MGRAAVSAWGKSREIDLDLLLLRRPGWWKRRFQLPLPLLELRRVRPGGRWTQDRTRVVIPWFSSRHTDEDRSPPISSRRLPYSPISSPLRERESDDEPPERE